MPEAVASHSIPMPEGQPFPATDLNALGETVGELEALTEMLSALLERDGHHSPRFAGSITDLFRGLAADFSRIHRTLAGEASAVTERPQGGVIPSADLDTHFEDIRNMLDTFNQMTVLALEADMLPKGFSAGYADIHRLIMSEMDMAVQFASEDMGGAKATRDEPSKPNLSHYLYPRIIDLVRAAWTDAGRAGSGDPADWPEAAQAEIVRLAMCYTAQVTERLEDGDDLLEAGSYLPWLELKIRKDMMGDGAPDDPASLRDRLIVEQAKAGVSAGRISQAFNLRLAAVERILGRLMGEDEQAAKAS